MEPRYTTARSHLYHETQSSHCAFDSTLSASSCGHVVHRLVLDLRLSDELLAGNRGWLRAAQALNALLLPEAVIPDCQLTLSLYDRISTALTVAQVCGVQRVSHHYARRLAPLPGPDPSRDSNLRLAQLTEFARLLASEPTRITAHSRQLLREAGLTGRDTLHLALITALVCLQARMVAVVGILVGQPQHVMPACAPAADAAPQWLASKRRWRLDTAIGLGVGHYAACDRVILARAWRQRAWRPLLRALSGDAPLLNALAEFTYQLTLAGASASCGWQPEQVAWRIHGAGNCLNALRRHAGPSVPVTGPWQTVFETLARSPGNLTQGQICALDQTACHPAQRFVLLSQAAAASGLCRIPMALGNTL